MNTDDLDNMSRRDLVELLEAYNESLAEVERLREVLKLFEHLELTQLENFRLEDWLGIYHKDVLREWCDYLGIPEVDE